MEHVIVMGTQELQTSESKYKGLQCIFDIFGGSFVL